jgi:coenzyme F420-reducing hydrogenase beta subunit
MQADEQGFLYPKANADVCTQCGLCEKVCPVLQQYEPSSPIGVYAAKSYDAEVRKHSSSGGMFTHLAEAVINEGGTVFGARFDQQWNVVHARANSIEELEPLRGSKYVQSVIGNTYKEVKEQLLQGRKVLFTGTPCQIAGLRSYLRDEYENLYTVDIACHGVPAPGLWEKYKTALEKQYSSNLKNVEFRDQSNGWRHYNIRYEFADRTVKVPRLKDPYLTLFLQDMTLRPSCYDCRLRNGRSGSDITLGDLWSVAQTAPKMNDDNGVSGVLINTEKGRELWAKIAEDLTLQQLTPSDVAKDNGGFSEKATTMPEKREEFFKGVHSAKNLPKYMRSYVVRKPLLSLYRKLRSLLSSLKRRILK